MTLPQQQKQQQPIRIVSCLPSTPSYLSPPQPAPQPDQLPRFCLASPAPSAPVTLYPTNWNPLDKSTYISLSPGNLRATYVGPGKSDTDAATVHPLTQVRANRPIPPICGVFYFEILIVSKGRDGYISIGVQSSQTPLSRLPGWEPHSWGYHGDDGNRFNSSGTGEKYGPTFTTGDVVGCLVDHSTKNCAVRYTKNGVLLGVAVQSLVEPDENIPVLYPAVGMRTPGEQISVNLGTDPTTPFRFDIEQYIHVIHLTKDQEDELERSVVDTQGNFDLDACILSFLVENGYPKTALAFSTSSGSFPTPQIDLVEITQRRSI